MVTVNEDTMSTIQLNGSTITLLGTAHVSKESVELVEEKILSKDFDCVAVELCPARCCTFGVGINVLSSTLSFLSSDGSATIVLGGIPLPPLKYPSLGLNSSLNDCRSNWLSSSSSFAEYRLSDGCDIYAAALAIRGLAIVQSSTKVDALRNPRCLR